MPKPAAWQPLGACLSAARQRRWLTQFQVAEQSGMSQSSYSQMERGLLRPRPANVLQLALVLGIGIDVLAVTAHYSLERILVAGPPPAGPPAVSFHHTGRHYGDVGAVGGTPATSARRSSTLAGSG